MTSTVTTEIVISKKERSINEDKMVKIHVHAVGVAVSSAGVGGSGTDITNPEECKAST